MNDQFQYFIVKEESTIGYILYPVLYVRQNPSRMNGKFRTMLMVANVS